MLGYLSPAGRDDVDGLAGAGGRGPADGRCRRGYGGAEQKPEFVL
jgi:hypothetical protein